jgi:23S rRNA pseudouridine1911/1915/1917 synthase
MKILYQDDNYIALLKDAGVPSQADKSGDKSIVELAEEITGTTCHIINRLDRPVGGICLLAKNTDAAAKITRLMTEGKIEKYYIALVCGSAPDKGSFEDYLMKNQRENVSKIVNKGNVGAKIARLEFEKIREVEKEGELCSLVRIHLLTGRHHQIRAQFAYHGLPLWGDGRYNPSFRFKRGKKLALFATELRFVNPYTGEEVCITEETSF